jgi:hypothetical protein
MIPPRVLRLASFCLLLAITTWAREPDACPHPVGWRPTEEELQRILSLHHQWAEEQSGLSGLMQLRELLQKAGLRELEREATFAIEYGRTRHAIAGWRQNSGAAAEGIFRMMAFDWTTGYGLYPGRALKIIVVVWLLLIFVYFWPIHLTPERSLGGGIYQVWPRDRIETNGGKVSLGKSTKINRVQSGTLAAFGRAGYFSLLSAFHIGWRDLNVGTWIARVQPREYTLRATGWVRVISGIQSLLSVYLLAMWALTYFGRPFQ